MARYAILMLPFAFWRRKRHVMDPYARVSSTPKRHIHSHLPHSHEKASEKDKDAGVSDKSHSSGNSVVHTRTSGDSHLISRPSGLEVVSTDSSFISSPVDLEPSAAPFTEKKEKPKVTTKNNDIGAKKKALVSKGRDGSNTDEDQPSLVGSDSDSSGASPSPMPSPLSAFTDPGDQSTQNRVLDDYGSSSDRQTLVRMRSSANPQEHHHEKEGATTATSRLSQQKILQSQLQSQTTSAPTDGTGLPPLIPRNRTIARGSGGLVERSSTTGLHSVFSASTLVSPFSPSGITVFSSPTSAGSRDSNTNLGVGTELPTRSLERLPSSVVGAELDPCCDPVALTQSGSKVIPTSLSKTASSSRTGSHTRPRSLRGSALFQALLKLLRIGLGRTKSSRMRSMVLLTVQFLLLISRTLLTVHCVQASTTSLTMAIGKGSQRAWAVWLSTFVLWATGGVLVNSGLRYLESLIGLALRCNLTDELQRRYIRHNAFYDLNNLTGAKEDDKKGVQEKNMVTPSPTPSTLVSASASAPAPALASLVTTTSMSVMPSVTTVTPNLSIPTPSSISSLSPVTYVNQRIVSDVATWARVVSHLYGHSFKPLLEFILSLREASRDLGYARPLLLFFTTFLASATLRLFTPPLGVMAAREAELEAELAAAHAAMASSAEEIALWNGAEAEGTSLKAILSKLDDTQRWFALERVRKTAADNLTKFTSMLTGGIFVHIPFLLAVAADPSERMARFRGTEEIMLRSGAAFTELLLLGKDLAELAGPTQRVVEVLDALEAVEEQEGRDHPSLDIIFRPQTLSGTGNGVAVGIGGFEPDIAVPDDRLAGVSLANVISLDNVVLGPKGAMLSERDAQEIAACASQNRDQGETTMLCFHQVTVHAPSIAGFVQKQIRGGMDRDEMGSSKDGEKDQKPASSPQLSPEQTTGQSQNDKRGSLSLAVPQSPLLPTSSLEVKKMKNEKTDFDKEREKIGEPRVLVRNLNLSLHPGTSLIITGPNGSGKSSLFRALAGLWPIQAGFIVRPQQLSARDRLLYRHSISAISTIPQNECVGESTAVVASATSSTTPSVWNFPGDIFTKPLLPRAMWVPQKTYMPRGTFRDQLTYPLVLGCNTLYDDRIQEAISLARLDTLFTALEPEGGLSALSPSWGNRLSGGEKQKCAFARVFFHAPKWVILDEATAALHPTDELAIYDAMKDCGITIASIAHRKSLFPFHDIELRLLGDGLGGYVVSDLRKEREDERLRERLKEEEQEQDLDRVMETEAAVKMEMEMDKTPAKSTGNTSDLENIEKKKSPRIFNLDSIEDEVD